MSPNTFNTTKQTDQPHFHTQFSETNYFPIHTSSSKTNVKTNGKRKFEGRITHEWIQIVNQFYVPWSINKSTFFPNSLQQFCNYICRFRICQCISVGLDLFDVDNRGTWFLKRIIKITFFIGYATLDWFQFIHFCFDVPNLVHS